MYRTIHMVSTLVIISLYLRNDAKVDLNEVIKDRTETVKRLIFIANETNRT